MNIEVRETIAKDGYDYDIDGSSYTALADTRPDVVAICRAYLERGEDIERLKEEIETLKGCGEVCMSLDTFAAMDKSDEIDRLKAALTLKRSVPDLSLIHI